jgi:hypothetical protein
LQKELKLENTLQPGDFVLQLQVRDKRAKKKKSLATQIFDSEIATKSSDAAISQIQSPADAKRKTVVNMTAEELR